MTVYEEAWMVAKHHHRGVSYDIFPYEFHIQQVDDILAIFYPNDHPIRVAGLLHDVVEDGPLSVGKIQRFFGPAVALIVADVTDPIDVLERDTKKAAVYAKITESLSNGDAGSLIVKLADRIANTRHSIKTQSSQLKMYTKEYPKFHKVLHAAFLVYEDKISSYERTTAEQLFTMLADLMPTT